MLETSAKVENDVTKTTPEHKKALVLAAFDTLFNKRDYEAAAGFWSESYIQHSAHIEPGHDGLFDLIRSAPIRCATNTSSSWRRAITSFSTAASRATAVPLHG
jgi:hypothetical protein